MLYAGSFEDLMQQVVGPAFTKATGYSVNGFSDGSDALASEIRGEDRGGRRVHQRIAHGQQDIGRLGQRFLGVVVRRVRHIAPGVGLQPIEQVRRRPHVQTLVRGGRPTGFSARSHRPDDRSQGRPCGEALDEAAKAHQLPELATLATSSANVFPETSLVGELQAGQLDAGFFYGVEASAAHLKTVSLAGTHLSAHYTITVLNRAPHAAAARAFVAFLLGNSGQAILKRNGLVPSVPPTLSGRHAVPNDLKHTV